MNGLVSPQTSAARVPQTFEQSVRRTFLLNLEHGLHLGPCALLVKTLRAYHSTVKVEANGRQASGDSILGLTVLGVRPGSEIKFTITGEDALKAMTAVEHLFDSAFEEA